MGRMQRSPGYQRRRPSRLCPTLFRTLKIGNKKCSLRPLVGCPFGSLFRVEIGPNGSVLARCFPSSSLVGNAAILKDKDYLHANGEMKDNRSLFDNNTAQGLSSEDIDAMKREGASGDEIVEALIANSSTFEKKTILSQEKYKIKKQKKYAPKVLLRRPCSKSICEAYFKKYPTRIGSLRLDALCLLLSMANVGAYSDVLVFDMVGGLLTGAVAERLGGTGYVCSAYFGASRNPIDIVRMFNFSSEVNSRIVEASLDDLCFVRENDGTCFRQDIPKIVGVCENTTFLAESVLSKDSNPPIEDGEEGICFSSTVEKLKTSGRHASSKLVNSWKERGFSSLIVAAPEMELGSLVQKLLPLLSFSAPFAIYSHCLQSLAMCMHKLQAAKMALSLQISEPWLREYQVLPSRTHPHMQMSAFGGYILSGIRICSDPPRKESKVN
ncbi:tRNA (adenine(58)-N(1))-methyltransferase non-catalytic subunit trm6 isoform X2 [Phalaenopsis equestris]|uniref:tRNA (adenine(58)-N(1))-methyltransferase non-catalytic subunit trm6 isoform X2 n=1 Tax=Phalaenopsis equestris TaxID=78828 RepID=UPI0009E41CF2|nr:tRNA (adenine(58)-N(1))-methyltransferase non-catalytic subunit trm6 isoform X2 [Phalaenopsis equestris]